MSLYKTVRLITLPLILTLFSNSVFSNEVNVYSYRQPFLIQPMFDVFTKETGIDVNVVFAKKGLSERLVREGKNSPADVVFTVDIGRLMDVVNKNVVQAVNSPILTNNIPPQYRDPEEKW